MAPSSEFEQNAEKVLDLVEGIPPGRCTTYGAIGRAIGIVPRYVALIMASAPDVHASPWHRVVGADATVKPGAHRTEQISRLRSEGFRVEGSKIVDFGERYIQP